MNPPYTVHGVCTLTVKLCINEVDFFPLLFSSLLHTLSGTTKTVSVGAGGRGCDGRVRKSIAADSFLPIDGAQRGATATLCVVCRPGQCGADGGAVALY